MSRQVKGGARRPVANLEAVRGPSEGTTATYRAYIQGFTTSARPQTVEGFAAYIEEMKGRRPAASVNVAIAAGKAAFIQSAQRQGMDARGLAHLKGVLAEVHNVRPRTADVSTVTPEERVKLFAALPLRVRLVAETLYQSGARVSEIVELRRARVKAGKHVELWLPGKGSRERQACITRELYARILAEFPHGEYLFTTKSGNPFARTYITREIDRGARRVLGRKVTAHVLRHSRATDLMAATGKVKGVSRMLGHANEATTLRYYVRQLLTVDELFAGL